MGMNHPITGKPFDYQRCCNTCVHFSDKTRTLRGNKYRNTRCALDPQHRDHLGDDTSWKAMPACSQHRPN